MDQSKSSNEQWVEGGRKGDDAKSNLPVVKTEPNSSNDALITDEGPMDQQAPSSSTDDDKTKVIAAAHSTEQTELEGSNQMEAEEFPLDLSVTSNFRENFTNASTVVKTEPIFKVPAVPKLGKPGKVKEDVKVNAEVGAHSETLPELEAQLVPLDLTMRSTPASTNSPVTARVLPTSSTHGASNPEYGDFQLPVANIPRDRTFQGPVASSSVNDDKSTILLIPNQHWFSGSSVVDPPKTDLIAVHKMANLQLQNGSGESVLAIKREETTVTVTTTTTAEGKDCEKKVANQHTATPKGPRGRPRKGTKDSAAAAPMAAIPESTRQLSVGPRPSATVVSEAGPSPMQPNLQLPTGINRGAEQTVPLYPFTNFNRMRLQTESQRSSTEVPMTTAPIPVATRQLSVGPRPSATVVSEAGPSPMQPNLQLPTGINRGAEQTVPLYPFTNFNRMRLQTESPPFSNEGYRFENNRSSILRPPFDSALTHQNPNRSHAGGSGNFPTGYPVGERPQEFSPWQHQHLLPPWYNADFRSMPGGIPTPPEPLDMYPMGRNTAMGQSARNALHNLTSSQFPIMDPNMFPNNVPNFLGNGNAPNFGMERARNENDNMQMPVYPNDFFFDDQPPNQAPFRDHGFNPGRPMNVRAMVPPPPEALRNFMEPMRFPNMQGYGTFQRTPNNHERFLDLSDEDIAAAAAPTAENIHYHQETGHTQDNRATGSQWLTAPPNFGSYGEGAAQRGHDANPMSRPSLSAGPSAAAGSSSSCCPGTSGSCSDLPRPSRVKRSRLADIQECTGSVPANSLESQMEDDLNFQVTIHRIRRRSNDAFSDPTFLRDAIRGLMGGSIPAKVIDEAIAAMTDSTRSLVEDVVEMALVAEESDERAINRAHLTEVIKSIYFSSFAHDPPPH